MLSHQIYTNIPFHLTSHNFPNPAEKIAKRVSLISHLGGWKISSGGILQAGQGLRLLTTS